MTFQSIGTFGYNCRIGKCDFIPLDDSTTYPRIFLYGIGFLFPGFLTTLSYIVIWWYVWNNDKYLKSVGHR